MNNWTKVGNIIAARPMQFRVDQNYPNPFNPVTTIKFSIPARALTSLIVYDVLGRKMTELINEVKNAGEYSVKFDASNYSSGIYFYSVTTGSLRQVKKMILVK